MGTFREGRLLGAGALAALCWAAAAPAQEKAVRDRVEKLLTVLADYRGDTRQQMAEARAAERELTEIGAAAAPQLIDAVLTHPPNSGRGFAAGRALAEIGKPALPALRTRWPDLNDERRWRLVPLLEKHDPGSVKDYAYNCLDTDAPIRAVAWGYVLQAKDPRAKERYFAALSEGEGQEVPYLRWGLLPGDKPVYDERRENDLLIDLLMPTSWVSLGKRRPPRGCEPPPGWPDGRGDLVRTLHTRKVVRAAPALLDLLGEAGSGAGHFAEQIIPALVEFGYQEAVPELQRIAASKPGPKFNEDVRVLAAEAMTRLKAAKR